MAAITLSFSSKLTATPARAWQWISSFDGISTELSPLLFMTHPSGVVRLNAADIVLGQPLFRSTLLLGKVLPIDYSELTFVEFDDGRGFIEQSSMGSMKRWRHERRITPTKRGCIVADQLTFQPKLAASLSRWFVQRLFTHRHSVLKKSLGADDQQDEQ